jgi:hypothetical protein
VLERLDTPAVRLAMVGGAERDSVRDIIPAETTGFDVGTLDAAAARDNASAPEAQGMVAQ